MEEIITNTKADTAENTIAEPRSIEAITAEILLYKQQAGAAILEIGRRLLEAKSMLNHGEWLPWLEEKAEFSEATAQRFMRLAREYPNPSPVTDLGASKALILLALPASEREEFATEKHLVNGSEKTVAEMSRRELETVIRERDEARKQATQIQTEMEEQLTEAENRAKGFEIKLNAAKDRAAADLEKAESEIADLQSQLKELLNAPKEVAVETVVDLDAVDAAAAQAKKEAEEKLRSKIEKAEKAKDKAEKDKAAVEQELSDLKAAQKEQTAVMEREQQAMTEQVQALQKKLAVVSSTDMTVFKLHFEQVQESINKMLDCIKRIADDGDTEGAAKLKNAMSVLLSNTIDLLRESGK